jgi:hypothetical protein
MDFWFYCNFPWTYYRNLDNTYSTTVNTLKWLKEQEIAEVMVFLNLGVK